MLPEYLYAVSTSMQEISRDDFNLLNGTSNGCDKDLCSSLSSSMNPSTGHMNKHNDHINAFDITTLNAIKLEDTSTVDLFPTHPNTWQQHPLNSHEHAHHRLNPASTSKLLLQSSDDPLICRGANGMSVMDDDHPAEFKTLIAAAVAEGRKQMELKQAASAAATTTTTTITNYAQRHRGTTQPTKRPQNGCSSLTKQQLKVKAGLMSAQNQQQQQQKQQQLLLQQQKQKLQQQQQQLQPAPTASNTKQHHQQDQQQQQQQPRNTRPKKKGAFKLRFHHQALPLEYLNHYEATQANARPASVTTNQCRPKPPANVNKCPTTKNSHENVRSWLQKIAEIQRTAEQQKQRKTETKEPKHDDNNNNRTAKECTTTTTQPTTAAAAVVAAAELATAASAIQMPSIGSVSGAKRPNNQPIQAEQSPALEFPANKSNQHNNVPSRRVVNYSDLPFMGEITLNMSKPRRGRKPKKADICHLIYKNYGTILPGTPSHHQLANKDLVPKIKTVVLEHLEQPLNLCLRDQSADLCSVSSDDEDETPASDTCTSNCPTPLTTPADLAADHLLSTNLKQSMQTSDDVAENNTMMPSSTLLHPVSVYYQKLLESGALIQTGNQAFGLPIETIEKDNQLALKISIPNSLLTTTTIATTTATTTATKQEKSSPIDVPALDYPEPLSTPSSIKSENSYTTTTATTVSSVNGQHQHQHQHQQQLPAQKRKRSAIFIPPMPAENTSNPATEVSICKFKFTGGAKPTLQEKKMLSVDADGNYRYFSGTGDKSMRGYEFFPRESLQQSGLIPGVNCTGAFLNATGEKILIDLPPPSAGLSHELLQIPDSPTTTLLLPTTTTTTTTAAAGVIGLSASTTTAFAAAAPPTTTTTTPIQSYPISATSAFPPASANSESKAAPALPALPGTSAAAQRANERKKKTRRSSQREKFEKTFKEKGFLIQTQQLESAEGATYCKFRQLKKFTRYLFRNWKDYLPDTTAMTKTNVSDNDNDNDATTTIDSLENLLNTGHELHAEADGKPLTNTLHNKG